MPSKGKDASRSCRSARSARTAVTSASWSNAGGARTAGTGAMAAAASAPAAVPGPETAWLPAPGPAGGGVGRMDPDRLAPADLRTLAEGSDVELAVQPGRGLIGDQHQRGAGVRLLVRLQPRRVAGAVRVPESAYRLGHDLDAATGSP